MLSLTDLKYGVRSRSVRFMRDGMRRPDGTLSRVFWKGRPLYYRPGTSDRTLIYRVLLKPRRKREYQLPHDLTPQVILDIGANIGATAVLFASRFPKARIYAFEPAPDNFTLLQKNTSPYPNITAFPFALGAEDASLRLSPSDDPTNHGGYSFFTPGTDPSAPKIEVPVRAINRVLNDAGVSHIDWIKIDTEGAEHEILTALDPQLLSGVSWITGELHGEKDFQLLDYLSSRFHIAIKKPLESRLSIFQARRK